MDVILLFDEIYLQKCEEYCCGESIGTDSKNNLYKGMVCFMIVGLKESAPHIIKMAPETEINGDWIMNELLDCLKSLQENGFNVRGIVCDNHASNVAAYKKLLSTYSIDHNDLWILFDV